MLKKSFAAAILLFGSTYVASAQITQPIQPRVGTNVVITTGGTAVALVTGPVNGGYILNPPNTASQGVPAENLCVDPVTTPTAVDSTCNGTANLLSPGQPYSIPPLLPGAVIKGNAATSGHKVTVVVW